VSDTIDFGSGSSGGGGGGLPTPLPVGIMVDKGNHDITTGLPTNVEAGFFYTVGGTATIGGVELNSGDNLIAITDSATPAITGFRVIDNTEAGDILRDSDVTGIPTGFTDSNKLPKKITVSAMLAIAISEHENFKHSDYIRKFESFGADNTGVQDCTLAVNSMLNKLNTDGFLVLDLGKKSNIFKIQQEIEVNVGDCLIIVGYGTLKASDTMSGAGLHSNVIHVNIPNFYCKDITIDGNRTARGTTVGSASHCLTYRERCVKSIVDNVTIYDAPLDCIAMSAYSGDPASRNITIQNCALSNWKRSAISILWGYDINIVNNKMDNSGVTDNMGYAINLEPNSSPLDMSVANTIITQNKIKHSSGWLMHGKKTTGSYLTGDLDKDVKNVLIYDNIVDCDGYIFDGTEYMFNFNNCTNVKMHNNVVTNFTNSSRMFNFNNAYGIDIEDNTILGDGDGVMFYGLAEGIKIKGNRLKGGFVGVTLLSTSTENTFDDNYFYELKSHDDNSIDIDFKNNKHINKIEPLVQTRFDGTGAMIDNNRYNGLCSTGWNPVIYANGIDSTVTNNRGKLTCLTATSKRVFRTRMPAKRISGNDIEILNNNGNPDSRFEVVVPSADPVTGVVTYSTINATTIFSNAECDDTIINDNRIKINAVIKNIKRV